MTMQDAIKKRAAKKWEKFAETVSADFISSGYGAHDEVLDFINETIDETAQAVREATRLEDIEVVEIEAEIAKEKGFEIYYHLHAIADALKAKLEKHDREE